MTNIITTTEGRKLDDARAAAVLRHIEIVEKLGPGWNHLREAFLRDRSEIIRETLFAVRMALCDDYQYLDALAKTPIPDIEPDIKDRPMAGEHIWKR